MEKQLISPLAYIDPTAQLGKNVQVAPFAYIGENVVIGDNCTILQHASLLEGTILGDNNTIYQNTIISATPQSFKYKGDKRHVRIGNNNTIRENVVIAGSNTNETATTIGDGNSIMEGVHICHDAKIGNNSVIGIQSQISGACEIEDCNIISSGVILQRQVRVGRYSLIQSGSIVSKDVPPYIIVAGSPCHYNGVNAYILSKYVSISERILRHITNTYRLIYKCNSSLEDAEIRIKQQIPHSEEIENIIEFIRASELGIINEEIVG